MQPSAAHTELYYSSRGWNDWTHRLWKLICNMCVCVCVFHIRRRHQLTSINHDSLTKHRCDQTWFVTLCDMKWRAHDPRLSTASLNSRMRWDHVTAPVSGTNTKTKWTFYWSQRFKKRKQERDGGKWQNWQTHRRVCAAVLRLFGRVTLSVWTTNLLVIIPTSHFISTVTGNKVGKTHENSFREKVTPTVVMWALWKWVNTN